MGNVISLHKKKIHIKRLYCECGIALSYWIDDHGDSYGLCHRCDLDTPDEIKIQIEENTE